MDSHDAREILRLAEVSPRLYSIGAERDESICLLGSGSNWEVYFAERGGKSGLRLFDSEDGAAVAFLKKVFTVVGLTPNL